MAIDNLKRLLHLLIERLALEGRLFCCPDPVKVGENLNFLIANY